MLSTHAPAESNRVPITDDVTVDVQSQPEDHPLMTEEAEDKDRQAPVKPPDKAAAPAPANKVLFLDGVRGLAAIMVVTRHSHEYMQDVDLGAVAVDMFFVLSSFLLTWLFMKKSFRMLHEKADIRWNEYRNNHQTLGPHIPTFLAGSMAAVIYYKLDTYITESNFQFRCIHKLVLRVVEYVALAIFLSLTFVGLFFIWVHENPAHNTPGSPFVSVLLTIVFVSELLVPSPLSSILEWSLLRYIGKISFSVYLLHGFLIYNRVLSSQSNYYCRLFSRFALITLLATNSYHVFEYPFQLLAHRITKALNEQETKGSGGWTVLLGEIATH
ncbi:hypothetical protein PsorP6_018969 [Peronosclerospora sorghi]|nr:hypothetical protein PsorP6_018960 [Peronosclerospora sorghi]KAI9895338.1 hypothetical protein PsorP6_018969 [Peronosclerospora sorghi]